MLAKHYALGQTQKNLVERDRCTSFRNYPRRTTADWCHLGQVTIDILPDDILLCIFNVHVNGTYKREEWRTLVHVCRRANPGFWFTTSPQRATFLLDQDTGAGEARYLASPSHCHIPS
jgi:hypothetical protein